MTWLDYWALTCWGLCTGRDASLPQAMRDQVSGGYPAWSHWRDVLYEADALSRVQSQQED